jgi:dipeptidase E
MPQIVRRLFTMGGGGFLEEPDNLLLDQFFFSLSPAKRPKVCFVGTATGDAPSHIERFYLNMKKHSVDPSHLSLFNGPIGSLRDFVFSKDVIYVGGGNTRNLLTLWKDWGLDQILKEAYQSGIVIGGISAGSLCWYEQGVTDSIPGTLSNLTCLGILKGSHCPHYHGNQERRPAFHRLIAAGMKDGIACDDGVAAVFENEKLCEFVSSRPKARAFELKMSNGQVVEKEIVPRYLGSK